MDFSYDYHFIDRLILIDFFLFFLFYDSFNLEYPRIHVNKREKKSAFTRVNDISRESLEKKYISFQYCIQDHT